MSSNETQQNRKEPNVVYHYCSLDTFHKIISNNKFRMSDVDMSNDYDERKEMIRAFASDEYAQTVKPHTLSILKDLYINNIFNLVICFSGKRDALSQWRGYADDGKGICIGFNNAILSNFNNPSIADFDLLNLRYCRVFYKNDEKERLIHGAFRKYKSWQCFEERKEQLLIKELGIAAMLCKNENFYEEQEWRLALCLNSESEYEQIKYKIEQCTDIKLSSLKTDCYRNKIVLYIEIDFSNVKDSLISEIIIGPKCGMFEAEIYRFLKLKGYKLELSDISKSQVTYRD